jgi:SAM-dependent methyltransferase
MKKLFKFILNTIPRPLLIRLSLHREADSCTGAERQHVYRPDRRQKFPQFSSVRLRKTAQQRTFAEHAFARTASAALAVPEKRNRFFYSAEKSASLRARAGILQTVPKKKNLDYTTTDLFSPLADVKADICNLPFADNSYTMSFCATTCSSTFPTTRKPCRNCFRVLKPGGMGIFQIPQDLSRENF